LEAVPNEVKLLDFSPRAQCQRPPWKLEVDLGVLFATTVLMYSRKVDLCSCAERRRRENELSGIMLSFVVARILVFQKACSLRSLTSLAFLLKWCPLDLQIP